MITSSEITYTLILNKDELNILTEGLNQSIEYGCWHNNNSSNYLASNLLSIMRCLLHKEEK